MPASPPQPGRPRNTSRERILDMALHLLDHRGPQALTLSTLAAELAMGISSLYTYFSDLAELEDEVAARLIGQVPALDAARGPLRDQLLAFGAAILRMHSVHPYLRLIAGRASAVVGARLRRANLAVLMASGVEAARANDCLEMIHALAYSGGSELHRLQQLSAGVRKAVDKIVADEVGADLVRAAAGDLSVAARHAHLFERCIDSLLPEAGQAPGARRRGRRAR
ncbi:MAG TPA: TetR/AcrR family transcriptional regulator [Nevskiaceae bacterium]|nr:TetR/AcrR family transcriptional regulator [Nevskiaceae bacterium]